MAAGARVAVTHDLRNKLYRGRGQGQRELEMKQSTRLASTSSSVITIASVLTETGLADVDFDPSYHFPVVSITGQIFFLTV